MFNAHQAVQNLVIENRPLIDGKRVTCAELSDKKSPVDKRVLPPLHLCLEKEVSDAVEAGRIAYHRGIWRDLAVSDRKRVVLELATLVEAKQERACPT